MICSSTSSHPLSQSLIAPKKYRHTDTALPNKLPKIVIRIVCLRLKPSSQPRNPVVKQLKFIVALAHKSAMVA